jgi:hypothetical protein
MIWKAGGQRPSRGRVAAGTAMEGSVRARGHRDYAHNAVMSPFTSNGLVKL